MKSIYINTAIMPEVDYAGYCELAGYDTRNTYPNYYTMIYVTGGALSISNENTKSTVHEGSLVLLHKYTIHTISNSGSKKASYIYINFSLRDFDTVNNHTITLGKTSYGTHQNLMKAQNIYILPAVTEKITGSILEKKIHDYAEYFNSTGRLTDLDINSRFYDIISECIKHSIEFHSPDRSLANEIISYLKDHYTEQLNTADMEKKFYLTYKYMGTAFKKETGTTILSYHTMLRMNYAKRFLMTTSYSIDEISRLLGYTDALYFSRVFKKNFGMSPQTFRKKEKDKL